MAQSSPTSLKTPLKELEWLFYLFFTVLQALKFIRSADSHQWPQEMGFIMVSEMTKKQGSKSELPGSIQQRRVGLSSQTRVKGLEL